MANADREISMLPALDAVTDETLIPVYQPGAQTPAQSMTGAQFRAFAEEAAAEAAVDAVAGAVSDAQTAAAEAWNAVGTAQSAAGQASSAAASAQAGADRAEEAANRAEESARGAQADWNQSNSEAVDYIRNRPFYRSVWLPMMELELIDQSTTDLSVWESYSFESYAADNPLRFTVDADYIVEYDGVNYSCKPFDYKTTFGVNRIAIGNPELLSVYDSVTIPEGVGADVPFAVAVDDFGPEGHGSGTLLTTTGGEHYAAIFALEKLPNEYLDADYIKEVAGEHGGGDSVQSDWNQNDSNAAGYIKNRPFYDGSVVILPETTLVFEDDGFFYQAISGEFDIKPGETYIVNWNGVEYECFGIDDGTVYLNGLSVADITYFANDSTPHLEIFAHEPGTVTVSISTDGIAKLPNKYLDADYIKEVSRDDAHIKEVVNEDYIKEVASEDYIKGVVNEDYIKEAVGEAEYIAPDWDQNNDSAAGYIKNRPFYTEGRGEVLPETDFELDGGYYCDANPAKTTLAAGETYTIRVYTDEYSVVRDVVCTEIQRDEFMEGVETWQVLEVVEPDYGTHVLVGFLHSKYTGEYYAMIESDDGLTGTVYVEIKQDVVVHKLPDKYLDMTAEEWTFELEDGTTVTKQVMVK